MANQTDFLDLYETLGLDPGCGLAEFKRSYRQHVAMRHPDRLPEPLVKPEAADVAPLQEVIAQYGAAMEFHRRHGRLPGASRPPPRFVAPVGNAVDDSPVRKRPLHTSPDTSPRRRSRMVVLLTMVAVGVLLWNVAPMIWLTGTPSAQAPPDHDASASDAQVTHVLRVGMSAKEVRAIEGRPQSVDGDQWHYGGSWVRFEHDQVVDWYSSALRPLTTVDSPEKRRH